MVWALTDDPDGRGFIAQMNHFDPIAQDSTMPAVNQTDATSMVKTSRSVRDDGGIPA